MTETAPLPAPAPAASRPADSRPADARPAEARPGGARTRSYDYVVGGLNLRAAMTMTGLDYMRALVAGEFGDRPSITDTIGMSIPHSLGFGTCSIDAEPGDWLLNPTGAVHGGFAATILDSVMGLAAHTAQPAGVGYTTAELKIHYTRAILPGRGLLRATIAQASAVTAAVHASVPTSGGRQPANRRASPFSVLKKLRSN